MPVRWFARRQSSFTPVHSIRLKTNLSDTGSIVLAESHCRHPIHARGNVSHAESILLFRVCTHGCNSQNLLVLHNSLLQLPVQYPQTRSIVGGPERVRETGHYGGG